MKTLDSGYRIESGTSFTGVTAFYEFIILWKYRKVRKLEALKHRLLLNMEEWRAYIKQGDGLSVSLQELCTWKTKA